MDVCSEQVYETTGTRRTLNVWRMRRQRTGQALQHIATKRKCVCVCMCVRKLCTRFSSQLMVSSCAHTSCTHTRTRSTHTLRSWQNLKNNLTGNVRARVYALKLSLHLHSSYFSHFMRTCALCGPKKANVKRNTLGAGAKDSCALRFKQRTRCAIVQLCRTTLRHSMNCNITHRWR